MDKEVDIYSLGLTLYYLANGWKSPFMKQPGSLDQAADQKRIRTNQLPEIPDISPALNKILLNATRLEKKDRYQSAREMELALQQAFGAVYDYETQAAGGETAATADFSIQPVYSSSTMTAGKNVTQVPATRPDVDRHGLYLSQKQELMGITIDGPQAGGMTFANLQLEIAEGALAVVFGTDFSTISSFFQIVNNCIAGRGEHFPP